MALPSSGQISLGGTGVNGNSVNVELGVGSTTQISLNQATVRTLFQRASGQISMSDGWGKSSASAPAITSQPGSQVTRCAAGSYTESVNLNYEITGSGTISYWLYYDVTANNGCTDQYLYTSGSFVSNGGTNYLSIGISDSGIHFRLKLTNSVGTTYSGWTKSLGYGCDLNEYCSTTENQQDNGSWGCHNCSQSCSCDPCTYDCNCDCVTGYGTGGCNCGSDCDWCSNEQNYVCDFGCFDCCPWDNCPDPDPYQCNCYEYNCRWENNPYYPCPCGRQTCSENCYCPCGETCGTGNRYSYVSIWSYSWEVPVGTC